jgi:hypothetical protein
MIREAEARRREQHKAQPTRDIACEVVQESIISHSPPPPRVRRVVIPAVAKGFLAQSPPEEMANSDLSKTILNGVFVTMQNKKMKYKN